MAINSLTQNVNQAISDFAGIKQAIVDKGVAIPSGTPTSQYAGKIGQIAGDSELLRSFIDRTVVDVTFPTGITTIGGYAFANCTNLTTINVPWASGAVSGAPWGATNATINYNYS